MTETLTEVMKKSFEEMSKEELVETCLYYQQQANELKDFIVSDDLIDQFKKHVEMGIELDKELGHNTNHSVSLQLVQEFKEL